VIYAFLVLSIVAARPLAAQAADRNVELLAALLAAEDARRYDAPLLRRGTTSPDTLVRRRAALTAGRVGDRRAGPILAALFFDRDPAVAATAAFAAGLLADSALAAPLIARLQRRPLDSATAVETVTALAKGGGRRGSVVLARLLDRELEPGGGAEPAGRAARLAALLESWRLPAAQPVAALRRYIGDPDPEHRWRAVYSLVRLRSPEAGAELLTAVRDSHPTARMYAVRGLTKSYAEQAGLEPGRVIDALIRASEDPEPGVRIWALLALGSWSDSTLAAPAIARLDDSIPNVRVQAAASLGRLAGARAVVALSAAHKESPVWAVRREALLALARAHPDAFAASAQPWARSDDWRERAAAAEGWALAGRKGDPWWRTDPDGRVMAAGLQAWSFAADSGDVALLAAARALLAHTDGAVRSVAADALARAPAAGDVPALVAAWSAAEADSFPEAARSTLVALAAIARHDRIGAAAVRSRFLERVPASPSYILRRWARDHWPEAAERWGPPTPLPAGRSAADYRAVVRNRLLGDGRRPRVRLETEGHERLELELLGDEAPLTVEHFLSLVASGVLDGGRWHRVVPNFVVQDGDPRGDGWGGPPVAAAPIHAWAIRDELNRVRYLGPVLGMALSGPDTGNSQWFVNLSPQPHLDGSYTVFGRVVQRGGLATITQGDSIVAIREMSASR
jgi:cyclophilin family peptidyl-prolyl cis-trans isomerase/HEAT repeat protein